MNKKLAVAIFAILLPALAWGQQNNPKALLKDSEQEKTMSTLRSVDGSRLYSLDYTADYRLQDVIDADLASQTELIARSSAMLLDTGKMALAAGYVDRPACAAFMAKTPSGDVLYCRNFDYNFEDGANIMMRTTPKKGFRSMSMVAASFPGFMGSQLSDGKTDLSGLVLAPYCQMDGMNQKGLCISVLQLSGESAAQYVPGKHSVMTSVMMRMILDRASTVDEAMELVDGINFFTNKDFLAAAGDAGNAAAGDAGNAAAGDAGNSSAGNSGNAAAGTGKSCNYHFFLADASGKSAVLEFIRRDGPDTDSPWVANVLDVHAVTNDYLSTGWENVGSDPNDKRLSIIEETLSSSGGTLTETDAMNLLEKVSQPKFTQWSVVYNVTKKTATVCMLVDYGKKFNFSLRGKSGWIK